MPISTQAFVLLPDPKTAEVLNDARSLALQHSPPQPVDSLWNTVGPHLELLRADIEYISELHLTAPLDYATYAIGYDSKVGAEAHTPVIWDSDVGYVVRLRESSLLTSINVPLHGLAEAIDSAQSGRGEQVSTNDLVEGVYAPLEADCIRKYGYPQPQFAAVGWRLTLAEAPRVGSVYNPNQPNRDWNEPFLGGSEGGVLIFDRIAQVQIGDGFQRILAVQEIPDEDDGEWL